MAPFVILAPVAALMLARNLPALAAALLRPGRRPVVVAAGGVDDVTVIGIAATPPPPSSSLTWTVTLYVPPVLNVTVGALVVEFAAPPSKLQL